MAGGVYFQGMPLEFLPTDPTFIITNIFVLFRYLVTYVLLLKLNLIINYLLGLLLLLLNFLICGLQLALPKIFQSKDFLKTVDFFHAVICPQNLLVLALQNYLTMVTAFCFVELKSNELNFRFNSCLYR